jgi:hypothetical protein
MRPETELLCLGLGGAFVNSQCTHSAQYKPTTHWQTHTTHHAFARAVQSPPFPPCAARRRGGPKGGWGGPPGLAPGPRRPPPPHVRKNGSEALRSSFVKPKRLQTVGEPGAACGVSELPDHGCCSWRWPTGCPLVASSFGGLRKDQMADENPT